MRIPQFYFAKLYRPTYNPSPIYDMACAHLVSLRTVQYQKHWRGIMKKKTNKTAQNEIGKIPKNLGSPL